MPLNTRFCVNVCIIQHAVMSSHLKATTVLSWWVYIVGLDEAIFLYHLCIDCMHDKHQSHIWEQLSYLFVWTWGFVLHHHKSKSEILGFFAHLYVEFWDRYSVWLWYSSRHQETLPLGKYQSSYSLAVFFLICCCTIRPPKSCRFWNHSKIGTLKEISLSAICESPVFLLEKMASFNQ